MSVKHSGTVAANYSCLVDTIMQCQLYFDQLYYNAMVLKYILNYFL
jgi:hypothetical protein